MKENQEGSKEMKTWSVMWLEVLKKSSFHPEMPRFGFADPVSYSIVENAVERLNLSGAVRHGAGKYFGGPSLFVPPDLIEIPLPL